MTMQHSLRRGAATALGGTLVLGAGMSLGVVTARMQQDWATAQQLDTAGADTLAQPAAAPAPVVVREVEVRHVTPDPVVVHRTVRRTVPGAAAPAQPVRRTTRASTTRPSAVSRRVVAPAPKPAPAPRRAPAATTSKTS